MRCLLFSPTSFICNAMFASLGGVGGPCMLGYGVREPALEAALNELFLEEPVVREAIDMRLSYPGILPTGIPWPGARALVFIEESAF